MNASAFSMGNPWVFWPTVTFLLMLMAGGMALWHIDRTVRATLPLRTRVVEILAVVSPCLLYANAMFGRYVAERDDASGILLAVSAVLTPVVVFLTTLAARLLYEKRGAALSWALNRRS